MAKKILLIENDQAFAGRISKSLESSGFEVRTAGDGKEGLELARDAAPHAIVLCVELSGMSGYLVCQKLKKDDALKGIPLLLTSAEATQETFDKHRTLKARADEYLLKPYEPAALLEKLGGLIGLPEAPPLPEEVVADEELVSLEEELGLDAADGEPEAEIIGLDLQSLPDEPSPDDEAGRSVDEDLRLLDDAFDGLSAAPAAGEAAAALDALTRDRPVLADDLDAAAASLPEEEDAAGRAALDALGNEAEAALGSLGAMDDALPALDPGDDDARPRTLDDDGVALLVAPAREPASAREPGEDLGREPAGQELRRKIEALSRRAEDAEKDAAQARAQAETAQGRFREAEADAAELRRKLAEAEERAAAAEEDARRKAEEAAAGAEATAKVDALERELDDLRTELLVVRAEAEGARTEMENRTAEVRKRVTELEAANAKNEERVVKAYQKIKADEKIREKVRKALAIATQLLDEGTPSESAADKERRAAALLGRE